MGNSDKSLYCCPPLLHLMIILLVFVTSSTMAQTGNLNRPYEPVVLKASSFPAFSNDAAPISQLFLLRYKSAGNTWELIPWQIDEVEPDSLEPAKTTYFRRGDGNLDDFDELAFMAKDAGDKAGANDWVIDASARGFPRYEIELSDPLVAGSKGYVYLYRSTTVTISPPLPDYVTYVPPPAQSGSDIIRGQSYEEGHLANGIHNSLLVPVIAGGTGADFLDRLKLRFQIRILFTDLAVNEDAFTFLEVVARDGWVRVIRELRERITLATTNIDFPILIHYFGYSTVLGTGLNLTGLPVPVNLLRQSFDFESNVTGAKWFNQNLANPTTVDGNPDNLTAVDLAVVNAPNLNWYMLSSAHGSFINIFSIPAGFGASQKFYYHDAPSGTNDGTPDTGTNGSFGDSGLLITADNITGTFALALTSYILGKDQPRSVGETLRNQTAQPLVPTIQPQSFTTGVKEAISQPPRRFALQQNHPNPVSLSQPATLIRYELPWSEPTQVELRIYNLLGQKIRELVNTVQVAGLYEARWNGRLENGKPAPAGIYFYQLRAGNQVATKKLMLLSAGL